MAAELNLHQLLERADRLQKVASASLGSVKGRESEVRNCEALLYSALHFITEAGTLLQAEEDPSVTFACALLEMLEDQASFLLDPEVSTPIYKAMGPVQEALGVPPDDRAWVDYAEQGEEPHKRDEANAGAFFVLSALSLFPQLLAEAGRLAPAADREEIDRLLNAAGRNLLEAGRTRSNRACIIALTAADTALGEAANLWGSDRSGDSELCWALFYGVTGAIKHGIEFAEDAAKQEATHA